MRHLAASPIASRVTTLLCATLLLPLAACGGSNNDIAKTASGLDFVTAAKVVEEKDGGRTLEVTVEADASSSAVRTVFSTLKDDIGDDDTVSVSLNSPAPAELRSAGGRVPDTTVTAALLATPQDLEIQSFRATVADQTSVQVGLTPVPFTQVVERGDELADTEAFDTIVVRSGQRSYAISPDDNAALLKARADLVSEIDTDFELIGVDVTGKGPVTLVVAPISRQAVRVLLDTEADSRHGVVNLKS